MKQLRTAMVGAGSGRGQSWMSTLTKLTEAGFFQFCALCEVVQEKVKEGADRWGGLPLTETTELEREMEAEFQRVYGHDYRAGEALAGVRFPLGGVRHTIGYWD